MKTNLFSDLPCPIAIAGLGISGTATHKLLLEAEIPSEQILTMDGKTPNAQFHRGEDLLQNGKPKTLVVSPGVPLSSPWIQEARKAGVIITSELSLASRVLTSEKVIGVTGSIGKSTTTTILQAALECFSTKFFVGGNLGVPLAHYATELLSGRRSQAEWVVLELSSYQLENFPELEAHLSIITYLTANHLERYQDKEEYYQTKWNLQAQTTGHLILNKNGGELEGWAQDKTQLIPWIWTDRTASVIDQYNLRDCELIGSHNLDNLAMAGEVALLAGWPKEAFEGMRRFRGLSHRVENLGVTNGIRFINDSKATTMASVLIAVKSTLESVAQHSRLHLLLGGKDKNLPWEELSTLRSINNISYYFFGECRSLASAKSCLPGQQFPTMAEAFAAASRAANNGDSVLLSPGGTSLDEFKNFEDRGEAFRQLFKAYRRP